MEFLWCLHKHQSITTENISTKIRYPLITARYLSLSRSANFLFFCVGCIFLMCTLCFKERTNFIVGFLLHLVRIRGFIDDHLWGPVGWGGGGGACLGL